ncbi:MAG: thioredoxin family protein [Flavobacteriales bacterium]|nr:thioredoxin family protein [Flavobacteriales bacterium]
MKIDHSLFESLPTFDAYFSKVQSLFESGRTTGDNQSEVMLNYTKLGIARTKRGLKTLHPSNEFIEVVKQSQKKKWMVITEAWCGDASSILPLIANTAKLVPSVDLRILLRDANPTVMNNFLTNGGKAIPIFVAMDDDLNYSGHWGPRPAPAQKIAMDYKLDPKGESHDEMVIRLQKWYLDDHGKTMEKEFTKYLSL